jgi:hypothetical protein
MSATWFAATLITMLEPLAQARTAEDIVRLRRVVRQGLVVLVFIGAATLGAHLSMDGDRTVSPCVPGLEAAWRVVQLLFT